MTSQRLSARIELLCMGLFVALLFVVTVSIQAHAAVPPPYPTGDPNVPALGFDSDLDEDGNVEVCPGGVKASLVDAAIADINETTSTLPGGDPHYVRVNSTTAWCEVKAASVGGASASYYARVVFGKHPDQLQISDRFANLSTAQKQGTITHEHTHMGGEDHVTASFSYFCQNAVVSTYEKCKSIGVTRRTTFGPEDAAAMLLYWDKLGSQPVEDGVEGPYPVHNKCWTTSCEHFGPPESIIGTTDIDGQPSSWVGSNQGTPVAVPPPTDGGDGAVTTEGWRAWDPASPEDAE